MYYCWWGLRWPWPPGHRPWGVHQATWPPTFGVEIRPPGHRPPIFSVDTRPTTLSADTRPPCYRPPVEISTSTSNSAYFGKLYFMWFLEASRRHSRLHLKEQWDCIGFGCLVNKWESTFLSEGTNILASWKSILCHNET